MTELAISMRNVKKTYPHFQLKDIDLQLAPGQMLGLIGQNGAGKSTTLRILMGLVHQDAGEVTVLGHAMPSEQVQAKLKIGFISEDMRLYPNATLAWHIAFLKNIFETWDPSYAQRLLGKFRLNANQKLKTLSFGQRVKASLLTVLARRPRLLILDEPTAGLDPVAKADVLAEMMEALLEEDRTIVFSSHNTADVEQLSDQIAFIDEGRILDLDDKESFLEKWRRIQLVVPDGVALMPLPHCQVTRSGKHVANVTAGHFDQGTLERYQAMGAKVQSVDRMSLEEIFVARVHHGREEVCA